MNKFAIAACALLSLLGAGAAVRFTLPQFGKGASRAQRKNYALREPAFDPKTKRFIYPKEWETSTEIDPSPASTKGAVPAGPLPSVRPRLGEFSDPRGLAVTWLGHSSLIIQMHGLNILIDPVFSQRTFTVQFLGPKRFSQPPLKLNELPKIDAVLITHDHYDHLDLNTVRYLKNKVPCFIVPLGVENHLARFGVDRDRITALAWWESVQINGLKIVLVPAQHISGRLFDDYRKTLYGGYALIDDFHKVIETGDSGYGLHFKEIHRRLGDFDLVLPDGAQYNRRWHYIHMFPEESVQAVKDLHAGAVMPVHWGAFALSDHAWDDPVCRYERGLRGEDIALITPRLGETVVFENWQSYTDPWWKNV